MDAEWEIVDGGTLPSEIVDPDLFVSYISAKLDATHGRNLLWHLVHLGCTEIWDKAYSCNSDNIERDDDPS